MPRQLASTQHAIARRLAPAGFAAVWLAVLALASPVGAASLKGEVFVEPGNEPGAGLWVRIERTGTAIEGFDTGKRGNTFQPLTVYTDAKGRFTAEHLPAGMYSVFMADESLPRRYAVVGRPKKVVLVSKDDRSTVVLEVTTMAFLAGTVTREDGTPVRASQVLLFHPGDAEPFRQVETDEAGRFVVREATPGEMVLIEARAPEGPYVRLETTPLRAGEHPVTVELPVWGRTPRQRVVLDIAVPRVGETALVFEWRSTPPDAPQGFAIDQPLGRHGRVELESLPGIFSVRVRELGKGKRIWEGERLFRVIESTTAQSFAVTVVEATPETASLPAR